jgi:hypothetical protein
MSYCILTAYAVSIVIKLSGAGGDGTYAENLYMYILTCSREAVR